MGTTTAAVTIYRSRDEVEREWAGAGIDLEPTFKDAPGDRGTEVHVTVDDSARGGYDQRDLGRHCFGFSYIDQRGPVDPSLRHAHVGQKVTVTIQEGDRRASMRVPLRAKNPHNSADAGGQGWFAALGCR